MIIIKVFIGADHLGVDMQKKIILYLKENSVDIVEVDVENHSSDDYTDFAFEVGKEVKKNECLGILICGNGIGMSIAANKVVGIRCARVLSVDDAFKCKNHNGANVISLSSEIDLELTKEIVDTFLFTKCASEERYVRRVNKIISYEKNNGI